MIKHVDADSASGFRFELTQDEVDNGMAAFMTGPIGGTIGLASGSAYDVSEDHIAVKVEDVEALQLAIHKAHHAAGRFLDAPLPSSPSPSSSK